MRKLFSLLTLLIIDLTAFGQYEIGLKANGGLSCISAKLNSTQITQKFYFVSSGQGGIFSNFHLGDKSLLGTELLFMQIEGKEHSEISVPDQYGNPTGQSISEVIWRHISYLSIPIYYGYKIKKLTINFGVQTSFMLTNSVHSEIQSSIPLVYVTPPSAKLDIDSYDFGIRAGLGYSLTTKFAIETTYYYGLNNILKSNTTNSIWKVQQMTVGLRYNFFTTRQKSETENK